LLRRAASCAAEADGSRVEAFSDGVLAIVITLLVPDIKTAALRRSYAGPALYSRAILAAREAVPISIGIQVAVPLMFFLPVRQGAGRG
jgi:Endosomal/lysosomal potassium channel TMEM175